MTRLLTALLLLTLLAACAAPVPASTPTTPPQPTNTIIFQMPGGTATSAPAIDWPLGPFTWEGETRPLLLAHFMPWYQTAEVAGSWGYHWTMNAFLPTKDADGKWTRFASHYTPLTGLYDSREPDVLAYQMQLMKLSGIDGVIVDWYGIEPFWDYGINHRATEALFAAVKAAGLKFVVCYEDQTILHMVENHHLEEEEAIPHAQEVMTYLQTTWFADEAYLKVNGQPVLMTFGPQNFKSDEEWQQIFSVSDPKPLFLTLDNKLLPSADAAYPWPPMWASTAGVLTQESLQQYLSDFYNKAKDWDYVVGGAFPGFHDIYKEAKVSNGYGFLDSYEGRTFHFTLQTALDHQPDLIQLITWNDYGEGTIIEPTEEFGYRYLEMVQEARRATDPAFTYTAADLPLPLALYQQRKAHRDDPAALEQLDRAADALLAGDLDTARGIVEGME